MLLMIRSSIVYLSEDLDFICQNLITFISFLDFLLLNLNICLMLELVLWDGLYYSNGETFNET
jgi:hypothetical protein